MGPGFESLKVHQWPIGQVVKTAASHAVNIGSNPVWVTKFQNRIVGIDCQVGPPVPIPNTEVKHLYADDSCRATGRENR